MFSERFQSISSTGSPLRIIPSASTAP
jgi:hypothetical protein